MPREAEQGGEQRERDRDHHRNGEPGREPHDRDERDARDREAADRDHHGDAGEQDRRARGRERATGRIVDRQAELQVLAMAGDDEQRVVDADTEPDHRRDRRRHGADVDEARDDRDQSDTGREADERDADRQSHRDDRAEREQQHDRGDEQADELLSAELGLHGFGREVATQLHAHHVGAVHLGGRVLEPAERRCADVVRGHVVLHIRVRDATVGCPLEAADRIDVGLLRDVGERGVDRGGGLRVRECARLRREHELRGGAGGGGEVALEYVQRGLGLDSRRFERVRRLAPAQRAEGDDADGTDDPREDDEAAAAHAGAAESVEERDMPVSLWHRLSLVNL